MKKFFGSFSKVSKVVALILCAAIILGGSIGLVAYAVDSGNKTENEKKGMIFHRITTLQIPQLSICEAT